MVHAGKARKEASGVLAMKQSSALGYTDTRRQALAVPSPSVLQTASQSLMLFAPLDYEFL